MTKLIAAVAAMGLFALPAVAGAQTGRETVVVSVPTTDDPLDADGVQRIETRLVRAISKTCESADDQLTARLSPDWQCRKEMRRDAMAKLSALRQAGGNQVAATSSTTAIMR